MKQQFNWLFPAKKVIVIGSQVFLQTQTRKPCFRNFHFQLSLSINQSVEEDMHQSTCRSSLLTMLYRSLLMQNKQCRDKTEVFHFDFFIL